MTVTVTPPGQGPGATGATFAWGPFRSFAFLAAPTPPECEAPPKDQSQLVSGIGLLMGRPRYRDYSRGGGRLSPGPFQVVSGSGPMRLPRPRFAESGWWLFRLPWTLRVLRARFLMYLFIVYKAHTVGT